MRNNSWRRLSVRSLLHVKSRLEMNPFRSGWDPIRTSSPVHRRSKSGFGGFAADQRCQAQIGRESRYRSEDIGGRYRSASRVKHRFCLRLIPRGGRIWLTPPIIFRNQVDGFCHWSTKDMSHSRSTSRVQKDFAYR